MDAGALPQAELHLMDKSIGEWIPALVDWVVSLGKTPARGTGLAGAAAFYQRAMCWCAVDGGYIPSINGESARNDVSGMSGKAWNKDRKELVMGISSFYGRGGPRTAER